MKYYVDGQTFTSQKAAISHIRNLLSQVGFCESVKKKNKEIFNKLVNIFSKHHGAIRKGVID